MARSVVALLFTFLVAGCLGAGDGAVPAAQATGGAGSDGPTVVPFGATQCQAVLAWVLVPVERLTPYLPAGFTAIPFQAGQAGRALLTVETDRCASIVGLNGTVHRSQPYAAIWVGATPPPALRVDGINAYFVGWESLIPDDDRRALLTEATVPAYDGAVRGAPDVSLGPRAMRIEAEFAGLGTFAITGASSNQVANQQGGRLVQYVEGGDGSLSRWTWSWRTSAVIAPFTAAGALTVPEGTWIHELLGATTVPASVNVATWTYSEGTIEFPLENPAVASEPVPGASA